MLDSVTDKLLLNINFISGLPGSGTSLLHDLLYQRYGNIIKVSTKESPFEVNKLDSYTSIEEYIKDSLIDDEISNKRILNQYTELYSMKIQNDNDLNINKPIAVLDKPPLVNMVRVKKLKQVFTDARFIIIFRNPEYVIEGWKRKWKIFNKFDLSYLCSKWEETHRNFLNDTCKFNNDVLWICYESFIKDYENQLNKISEFCHLEPGSELKRLKDRPNKPGKRLRNIKDGMIGVLTSFNEHMECPNLSEQKYIDDRLGAIYDELNKLSL